MVIILRVTAIKAGERTYYYPTPDDRVFPTVEMAREFFKNEFKTNEIILCYANK